MEELAELYEELDRDVGLLTKLHGDRLKCARGCSACCVDGLSVFQVEAQNIRRHGREGLRKSVTHPAGACAFLDEEGTCRIYSARPYVCRTQGLPLRWLEEREAELVELRDICPLNEEGPPIETLPESECWTIGHYEGRLAELQQQAFGNQKRVRLRRLFQEMSR